MKVKVTSLIERIEKATADYEITQIPTAGRRAFITVLLVWLGFNLNISEIVSGALIYAGLGLGEGFLAVLIGCALLGIVGCLVSTPGQKLGITWALQCRYVWGSKGSVYPAFMIGFGNALWVAFMVSMAGYMLYEAIGIPLLFGTIVSAGVFMITALIGFRGLAWISYATVLAVVFGLAAAAAISVAPHIGAISVFEPAQPQNLWWGVSMAYATWVVGVTHTGDIVRYARRLKDAWGSTLISFLVSEVFLMTMGGLIVMSTGETDLIAALVAAGFVVSGTIIVWLATWTTTDNCLYNSALAGSSIANTFGRKIKKWRVALIVGIIFGMIIAPFGIYLIYEGFLTVLMILWVPFAGIAISDYWLVYRGKDKYHLKLKEADQKVERFNLRAISAYIIAVFTAAYIEFWCPIELPFIFGSTAFSALGASILSYWLLSVIGKAFGLKIFNYEEKSKAITFS